MKTQLKTTFICITIFASTFISCSQKAEKNLTIFDTKKITKENILTDLNQFVNFIKETHPRIGYTANEKSLDSVVETLKKKISDSMSIYEAWDLFASLKPIFNDAHIGLIAPENIYQEYVSSGGFKLPFSIKIKDGSNQRQLTFNEVADVQPSWYPDGSIIKFGAYRHGKKDKGDIYTIRRNGKGSKRMTPR